MAHKKDDGGRIRDLTIRKSQKGRPRLGLDRQTLPLRLSYSLFTCKWLSLAKRHGGLRDKADRADCLRETAPSLLS